MRRVAYLASALAIASAAVSVFWTFGGTWLLDTIGGSIEKLARTRSRSAVALGTSTSLAKIGAGLLALALVRPWGRHVPDRMLKGANVFVSAVLVTWGGANVLIGGLALAGVVSPAEASMNARCAGTLRLGSLVPGVGERPWRSRYQVFGARTG